MRRVVLSALAASVPALAFAAGPTYKVVDLGPLPGLQWAPAQPLVENTAAEGGGFLGSLGGGVTYVYQQYHTSSTGLLVAVGESSVANPTCNDVVFHAFLFQQTGADAGTLLDLGTLGGCMSAALSVSSSNVVVGWSQRNAGTSSAQAGGGLQTGFVWKDGTMFALSNLIQTINTEQEADETISVANAINDAGEIVGWSIQLLGDNQFAPRAVIWESSTAAQPLELQNQLAGASGSVILTTATGINCQGDIAATGYPAGGSTTDIHSYLLVRRDAQSSCPSKGQKRQASDRLDGGSPGGR